MAIHIENLQINRYRGIKNLQIANLGKINIIVGGNNSGKTSTLEAIQLLCTPNKYDLIRLARQRENYRSSLKGMGTLDSFLYLFDAKEKNKVYSLNIAGKICGELNRVSVTGELVEQLVDPGELEERNPFTIDSQTIEYQEEVQTFVGYMESSLLKSKINLDINKYSRLIGNATRFKLLETAFVRVVEHIIHDPVSNLIREKRVKEEAVQLLKIFDDTVTDIRYVKDDRSYFAMISSSDGGEIPLSAYGDGMKKALTILNAMMRAKEGVVLIDEFETALHTAAMRQVFKFILEISKQLNIQLFLTTHNIEALDKLLECAETSISDVRVIRLRKKADRTFASVIEGQEALEERNEYNMELRV